MNVPLPKKQYALPPDNPLYNSPVGVNIQGVAPSNASPSFSFGKKNDNSPSDMNPTAKKEASEISPRLSSPFLSANFPRVRPNLFRNDNTEQFQFKCHICRKEKEDIVGHMKEKHPNEYVIEKLEVKANNQLSMLSSHAQYFHSINQEIREHPGFNPSSYEPIKQRFNGVKSKIGNINVK